MASKRKQAVPKHKSACGRSLVGERKKPVVVDPVVGERKKPVAVVDPVSSDGEDSDLERNFAIFSKPGSSKSAEQKEESDIEEEEGDGSSDDGSEEEEGDLGSDDGSEEDEGDCISDDGSAQPGRGGPEFVQGDVESGEREAESESDSEEDDDDEDDTSEDEESTQSDVRNDGKTKTDEEDIKSELSTMSFEDIMKLQNKVGMKVYNEVAYGTKSKQAHEKKKRLNKNRPMEISAKRRAPFLRQVVPVKKAVLRDPRFDDLSGEYKPEIFEQTYSFINDLKKREKEEVQKKLRKVKRAKTKEQLGHLLKRMVNQEEAHKQQQQQREKQLELKRKQRELVGEGQRPYFLKKSDQRKLELAEKYRDLKRSGKLESFLSKKRKRNATKDRRKLPPAPAAN